MMPHPERRGRNVFENVDGNKFLPIFQNAYKALKGKESKNIADFEENHNSL